MASLIATAVGTGAVAQDFPPRTQVAARVEHYVDDDATTVVRPRISAVLPAGERTEITASYMTDVVSSASIDVVSRATQGIREERHEGAIGVTRLYSGAGNLGGVYAYGREPDYETHAFSFFGGRDLGESRLFHASGRLQLSWNEVGAVGDPRFSRNLGVATASGSLSRIVDAATLVRGTLEVSHGRGFQSSPYRTVRLGDWSGTPYRGSDPDMGAWVFTGVTGTVVEAHPEDRFRARFVLDGARAFARSASIAASVAGYVDTWRVAAGDVGAELRYEPRPLVLLRLGGRAYLQSSAYFFRQRYTGEAESNRYVTDDKELGPLRSYSIHGAAGFPVGSVRIDVRVEATRYRYPEFTLLPQKHALATQVGIIYRR